MPVTLPVMEHFNILDGITIPGFEIKNPNTNIRLIQEWQWEWNIFDWEWNGVLWMVYPDGSLLVTRYDRQGTEYGINLSDYGKPGYNGRLLYGNSDPHSYIITDCVKTSTVKDENSKQLSTASTDDDDIMSEFTL